MAIFLVRADHVWNAHLFARNKILYEYMNAVGVQGKRVNTVGAKTYMNTDGGRRAYVDTGLVRNKGM